MMRLALRIQRFEVWASLLLCALVGVSALIVHQRLLATGTTAECANAWIFDTGPTGLDPACERAMGTFLRINQDEAAPVIAGMQALPLLVGVLLGVGLVGREIEGGTAATVWALAGSRARWLRGRLGPILLVLFVGLGFMALARSPWLAGGISLDDAGEWGPGIVARGLAGFALAVAVGAVVGRMLPAVLLSTLLAFGLFVGGEALYLGWIDATARVMEVPANWNGVNGGRVLDEWYESRADGRRIQSFELQPPSDVVDYEGWLAANYRVIYRAVLGSDFPGWAATETAAFGGLALALLLVTFPIVERRRPF